jgi:hypothetical protein
MPAVLYCGRGAAAQTLLDLPFAEDLVAIRYRTMQPELKLPYSSQDQVFFQD